MFISAKTFIKGIPYWDFNNKIDIHRGQLCYIITQNSTGDCNQCILNSTPGNDKVPTCQTEFIFNPDLQASIDAFMESHPEYFI